MLNKNNTHNLQSSSQIFHQHCTTLCFYLTCSKEISVYSYSKFMLSMDSESMNAAARGCSDMIEYIFKDEKVIYSPNFKVTTPIGKNLSYQHFFNLCLSKLINCLKNQTS